MTLVPLTAWNISIILIGYLISMIGGRLIIDPIIAKLWEKYIPSCHKRYPILVRWVGAIESFLYTTCILIGTKEFIVVWLALKFTGTWSPTKNKIDRPLYHLFLIGNGLSLIIAAGTGFLIQILVHW